jgi:HK97 family phage major capsid protein
VASIPVHEAMAFTAVSRHLVMDSKYPLEEELLRAARVAFAKLEGTEFITGTGVGEFMGLNSLTLPTANVITGSDSTNHKVSAVDIQKLLHETINAAYLAEATLLLNKKTLGAIRQLTATPGAIPMFPVADRPGTLAGVPYVLCPDMDEAGAANRNAVYLLHPSAYTVAQRQDVTVLRLSERYADVGKIGYFIYLRSGGSATLTEAIAKIITA